MDTAAGQTRRKSFLSFVSQDDISLPVDPEATPTAER